MKPNRRLYEEAKRTVQVPIQEPRELPPRSYIIVPGISGLRENTVAISKNPLDGFNNLNYEGAHKKLMTENPRLYVPTPWIFMQHLINVKESYENRKPLFYFEGGSVEYQEKERIYNQLICAVNSPPIFTWLNAKLVPGSGFRGIDLETTLQVDSKGEFQTKKAPFLSSGFLGIRHTFANFSINAQGFPNEISPSQTYIPGSNLRTLGIRGGGAAAYSVVNGKVEFGVIDPMSSMERGALFACTDFIQSLGGLR